MGVRIGPCGRCDALVYQGDKHHCQPARTPQPAHGWRYQSRAQGKGEAVTLLDVAQAGHFELIAPWTAPGQAVIATILQAILKAL